MVRALNEPFAIIETERLILRPWLASDAESLFALASHPAVGPLAGWPPHESVDESAKIIATVFAAPETYAVVLRETGELVGCAGFNGAETANMPLDEGELELGYWIGKPFWGRGFATEAARAVVERGFTTLGLSGIHAAYFDGNERSRRVLDKLGFTHVRTELNVACPLLDEVRTEHFMYRGKAT
ncbi:MAG: GNAT family N-acetyltransferase [Eggerthellaceae bacterium]|nr:GNAT family N-acetyltransferase [Eggerthellaceae bacterium]